jgi:hypothetical protein
VSLHIARFLDKIKAAEGRRQRDVTMTVNEARDLHTDITKLLLTIQELRDTALSSKPDSDAQIEVDGGSW